MSKFHIHLGKIQISQRDDIRWYFEPDSWENPKTIETALKSHLRKLFPFPIAKDIEYTSDKQAGVDLTVPFYSTGAIWDFSGGKIFMAIFWRPEIKLHCRLYRLQDNAVIEEIEIRERSSWREYFIQIFSLKGSSSRLARERLAVLLNRVSFRLLKRLHAIARD